jgi:hypothetical protein
VGREKLSAADLIDRVNAELAQYRAADGCRLRAVQNGAARRDGLCNWIPSEVEVTPGAGTRYVSILARVIRDFQARYDVAGNCTHATAGST